MPGKLTDLWQAQQATDPSLKPSVQATQGFSKEKIDEDTKHAIAASQTYIKAWLAQDRPPYDPAEELSIKWWDSINSFPQQSP